MKQLLLLSTLLASPVMAEGVGVGIARLQYPKIQRHFANYERANKLKDWELACSELRSAMTLVVMNFDGLQQMWDGGGNGDWWQFRRTYQPVVDSCDANNY